MKHEVRVIKTPRDYDAALARLSALMDKEITPGSAEETELELRALVIGDYERTRVEPAYANPIDAILFRMDQLGLKKKDMIPYFGSLSKVSEVLARKRPLTLSMMRHLHKRLDIPADILLGSPDNELALSGDPQYDYSKFPLQEMLERGYFENFSGSIREVKEKAEELVRNFMRSLPGDSAQLAYLRAPLHQSGSRTMDEYALLVWQIAVLKKARRQKPERTYRIGSITADWLRDLAKLSRFEHGPRLVQEYLADIGIVLVIEGHFKKTYLDGAAMLDGDTPIIALTLRHDRLDNFWFALIHELVHVQKHLAPGNPFIPDNLDDKTRTSEQEVEADQGAREVLIPMSEWEKFAVKTIPTKENAIAAADQLRIHPSIVAGRVRHETKNWRLLTSINAQVRTNFADQLGDKPMRS